MNIGIIGSGRIGANAARLFAKAGHAVTISNSRGPASLAELVAEIGPNARAATVEDAVTSSEVILLALPWMGLDGLPAAEHFRGKIVIDATNPYAAGGVVNLEPSTSSEEVAKRLPGARLVKAFNTIYFEHLRTQGSDRPVEDRRVIFVAGDDAEAKATVSSLIEEIGFGPVDTGSLHEGGRRQQPGSPIYNRDMTAAEGREALGLKV